MSKTHDIINKAEIPFDYQIEEDAPAIETKVESNLVLTQGRCINISLPETVDKAYGVVEDELLYTIQPINTGNIPAENTIFLADIQAEATFIVGSVMIDGVNYPDYDPREGFQIGKLEPYRPVSITFKVRVKQMPVPNIMSHQSKLIYDYKIDPTKSSTETTTMSNKVNTIIEKAGLTLLKTVSHTYAEVGSTLIYNTVILNTGTVPLTQVNFIDPLDETVRFLEKSFTINSIKMEEANPSQGVVLPSIDAGNTVTLSFEVIVENVPKKGQLTNVGKLTYEYQLTPSSPIVTKQAVSNEVSTYIINTDPILIKSADKTSVLVGDQITFTVTIQNRGTVKAERIFFCDPLASCFAFNRNSVQIQDTLRSAYNPTEGFYIDDMKPGDKVRVSFSVTVLYKPPAQVVDNEAMINFEYLVTPSGPKGFQTANSNRVSIGIQEITVSIKKRVNAAYAMLWDTLTYTLLLENIGSVTLKDIFMKDVLPTGLSLIQDTVTINGKIIKGANPTSGILLPDVPSGSRLEITFQAQITNLPTSMSLSNEAAFTYTYQIDETLPSIGVTALSNRVTTVLNTSFLKLVKQVDEVYAQVGDIVTFDFILTNTSALTCSKVVFKDSLIQTVKLVKGSVVVDGKRQLDADPNLGFSLEDLESLESILIQFKVQLMEVPPEGMFTNSAAVTYSYQPTPLSPFEEGTVWSNVTTTTVIVGSVELFKTVSKTVVMVGEGLVYSFQVINTGNVEVMVLYFRDVLPKGLIFQKGTVMINGEIEVQFDPYRGFSLPPLLPGEILRISFECYVETMPTTSEVKNVATLSFAYIDVGTGKLISKEIVSNAVFTEIYELAVQMMKQVDRSKVTAGEALTYTVQIRNTGNITLSHAMFVDQLPQDLRFIQGTVYVDEVAYPGLNPVSGFEIGHILPEEQVEVSFKVSVISEPQLGIVFNSAKMTFDYQLKPDLQPLTSTFSSNQVATTIILGILSITKWVDESYALVKDFLEYSFLVKNLGNTTINQIQFQDTLEEGAEVVKGTIKINGSAIKEQDSMQTLALPDLAMGETCTISFEAQVTKVPEPPEIHNQAIIKGKYEVEDEKRKVEVISNVVTTQVVVGSLSIIKASDKEYAALKERVTYTILVTNIGNVGAKGIYYTDDLPSELSFVPGSVRIGDVIHEDLDPTKGFALADMMPQENKTISYDVVATKKPVTNYAISQSKAKYSYTTNEESSPFVQTGQSNEVETAIIASQLSFHKSVDKTIATIGEELIYTVQIINQGNVEAYELLFQDILPEGVLFKENSFKVNGQSITKVHLTQGIDLGNLGQGDSLVLEFVGRVMNVTATKQIVNQGSLSYYYYKSPLLSPLYNTIFTEEVTTYIAVGELAVVKNVDKEYATPGDILVYTITMTNVGSVVLNEVKFTDQMPKRASFVPNSMYVNGVNYPEGHPEVGFTIDKMAVGEIVTVRYSVAIMM